MAVDEIVRRHSFAVWRVRFQAMVAEGEIDGRKALAMKPITFMNESGRAVGEALRFYKLNPPDLIVLHDELDLVLGKIRVKRGGGHAGHNGLRSIDAHIGDDFWRVRMGIGHPGDKEKVHGHVLSDFAKAEQPLVDRMVEGVAMNFGVLAAGDEGGFMSRVAQHVFPPPPKPPKPPKPTAPPVADEA